MDVIRDDVRRRRKNDERRREESRIKRKGRD